MRDAVYTHVNAPKQPTKWELALGLEGMTGLLRLDGVQDGLPVAAFHRFAETSGVAHQELATAVGISLRTFQCRGADGRLDARPSERLVRLADLFARAEEVTGGDALARQWMQTPRDAFDGRTPLQLAVSELGAREVEDLLLRVEYGVFY